MRFLSALLVALVAPLSAQETMMRQVFDPLTDTHVEVVALFTKPSPGGYLPVRVKIANNLRTDRSIQLDFESTSSGSGSNQANSTFKFAAAGGKIITRDILVPLCPNSPTASWGSNLSCELSGSLGSATNRLTSLRHDRPSVLLSEALFTPNASALDAAIPTSSYGGSAEFSAKFDPKQLPDSWLAFSGYDSILMTDGDWTSTPSSARNAILSWVRLGGQLVIYSTGSSNAKGLGLPEDSSFGSVQTLTIPSDLKLDPKATLSIVEGKNPNKPNTVSIRNDYDGVWPLQAHFGSQKFRYGLFIAVLIIFAVVVGPVNLFVFAKSGQRHKLFITTPIISLIASLILIALIIVQDGFGGAGMRRVLMEVRPDGDQNAAYLHQEQFARTGVLTGSSFTLAEPCVFAPVPISESRWARFTDSTSSRNNFSLQPADGKLDAAGDWFQSRSEHGHALSTVTSTRGRIESTGAENTFLSTFDFPIDVLFYRNANGDWSRAEGITTGKRFTLTPIDYAKVQPVIQAEIKAFTERNSQILKRISGRPGCYVAITNQAPGIDTSPSIRWKGTRTVITGPVFVP